MPLLLLLLISVLQWFICFVFDEQTFDYTAFLYGNLQIIVILFVFNTVKKYVRY